MTSIQDTDRARQVLIRALRAAFPHANMPVGPYERTADKLIADAAGSAYNQAILRQGLADLDALAGGDFVGLSNDEAYQLLKGIECTVFFGYLRLFTSVALYDDADLWQTLGYEGSSFEHGGYLHRGFNDLDWLPEPRVTLYEGPATFVPIAAGSIGTGSIGAGSIGAGSIGAGSIGANKTTTKTGA